MLKAGTLSIAAKVIKLQAFWNRPVDVFVVPLVGINLFGVLVLKRAVARRVKRASPLPAARICLVDKPHKPLHWSSFWAPPFSDNLFHLPQYSRGRRIFVLL